MNQHLQKLPPSTSRNIRIALFCGGRGSATIIREILHWPNADLTLLVNAYDDGLSTGALRNFIPGMLGPSDFRKNLTYLLDLYSDAQYALQRLIELRLPMDFGPAEAEALYRYAASGTTTGLPQSLARATEELAPATARRMRALLKRFLDFARAPGRDFDYRDCSVGNLIFAGAYLECGNSFNAAAREMSALVGSQAVLVNVSRGENRVLTALKADGQILSCEAEIVGKQSSVPILDTFFMPARITPEQRAPLADHPIEEKVAWLKAQEVPTPLSEEARNAIEDADIIVYGPGTQHSSLLPSYRIAEDALKRSKARVKAMVLNLGEDNDIQGLSADQLVDRALFYANDPANASRVITHLMYSRPQDEDAKRFADPAVERCGHFRGATIVTGAYARTYPSRAHNGHLLVRDLFRTFEMLDADEGKPSLDIFVDLYKRASAAKALTEEFFEIDWAEQFSSVRLSMAGGAPNVSASPAGVEIRGAQFDGPFPEVHAVLDWLANRDSEFFVTLTGDGEYRFRDVMSGVRLLRDSIFGAVYGSRTQSRRQFRSSLRAAYGDGGVLRTMSALGAFLLSMLFGLRFGVIFSDPLTGFRIYRRRHAQCLKGLETRSRVTPTSITRMLVANDVEIAELPVRYRTYVGFTDPWWRLRRGLGNLMGLIG